MACINKSNLRLNMALEIASIALVILAYKKLTEVDSYIYSESVNERRNFEEPLSIDAWKGFGQVLPNSGHPDELLNIKVEGDNIERVRRNYGKRWRTNEILLRGENYNDQINRRTQFSGPSDEVTWPTFYMGSNWYSKSVRNKKVPTYTRIVPW
jgi:hypothetical protein